MRRSWIVIALAFLPFAFSSSALAKVRVAFLMQRDSNGKIVYLEPHSWGFSHVAISYKGRWLHAYPEGGVQLSRNLNKFGEVIFVLENKQGKEPSKKFVKSVLGLPYDFTFNWARTDSSYCAKLLAGPLKLAPSPMRFDGSYWKNYFQSHGIKEIPKGPGLSPDKVFDQILKKGFRPVGMEP